MLSHPFFPDFLVSLSPGALPRALISFLSSLPSLKLRDYIVYLCSPSTVKGPLNLGYSFWNEWFWGLGTQPGGVRHPRPPSFFLKFHVPTTPLNLRCHGGNIQVVFIIILFRMPSSKGLVGLAISYALSVTDRLSGMVTSFTETEKQMVSVERAVQYIEDVQPEISPRGTVSINNKWLVFTSSNLFLPWPWLRQEMTRVKTLLIVLRSGRFSRFAHNCFRYLIFFGTTIRRGSCT